MATNNPFVKKPPQQKRNKKELSYIQKCILFANISTDKEKILISPFENIPLVKLYMANVNQSNFVYTNLRGPLCLFVKEERNTYNYFLQLYDINFYTLVFSLQITEKLLKELITIDPNFLCIPTKQYTLGFKFRSKESMDKFLKIFACPKTPDKSVMEMNMKSREFKCPYKDILKAVKDWNFDKKLKALDANIFAKADKSRDRLIFYRFDEIYNLTKSIEFDEENKVFNVFIDRSFNPRIINTYIDVYKKSKNKNSLVLRMIFDDYNHISNKNMYIDLLIGNLLNNFSEARKLIVHKKEHRKRHNEEQFEEAKRNELNMTKDSSASGTSLHKTKTKNRNSSLLIPSSAKNAGGSKIGTMVNKDKSRGEAH